MRSCVVSAAHTYMLHPLDKGVAVLVPDARLLFVDVALRGNHLIGDFDAERGHPRFVSSPRWNGSPPMAFIRPGMASIISTAEHLYSGAQYLSKV